jgi:(E)-4-hydroxy-3-methylbut-2-enyl-diphosphate synthase
MCSTDTRDIAATLQQINALAATGCEIVRCAVPDRDAADALATIKASSPIPVIADIHFDYKLALLVLQGGIDGLRLNPGNIGEQWKVAEVVKAAAERRVPIRIGVNAGSLEKHLLEQYGHPTAEAMVASALGHIRILEDLHYQEIKVSLKASDVPKTVEAYRLLASQVDYPLHIGITEAGTIFSGTIKSAVGLGILLYDGIGDTLRVSLTGDPVDEVRVGYEILKSLGLRQRGVNFVSCPTCGRCQINLIKVAEQVEKRLQSVDKPITVAVMGCVVNGPGEAREADVGIAGGKGEGLVFRKGEIVRKVPEAELADALLEEITKL